MNTSKLKTLFSFLFAVLISYGVSAQDYTFKVTSVKGDAKVNGAALKVGSKIQSGTITVTNGALLNIVHKTGKPLNVSKAGSYKVDVLDKACSAKPGSLSEKYAAYVLKELTAGDDGGIGAKNQSKTGSVTRDIVTAPVAFMTPIPLSEKDVKKKTVVYQGKVTLQWYANSNALGSNKITDESAVVGYKFIVSNLMSEQISVIETAETSVTLDMNDSKYANEAAIHYQVIALGNNGQEWESEEYLIEVDRSSTASIKQDLEALAGDESALSKLIMAKYFEEKGLVANALYAYEEAVKLSESNEMYKNMYQAFLDRNYLRRKSAHMNKAKKEAKVGKENK